MTKTGTKFLDPMLSWRRVLMAMHPLEVARAEDIAAASGVPLRTVRPYLCQFRAAGLVSQEEMAPQEWYRDVRKELVEKAFSLRELIEAFAPAPIVTIAAPPPVAIGLLAASRSSVIQRLQAVVLPPPLTVLSA